MRTLPPNRGNIKQRIAAIQGVWVVEPPSEAALALSRAVTLFAAQGESPKAAAQVERVTPAKPSSEAVPQIAHRPVAIPIILLLLICPAHDNLFRLADLRQPECQRCRPTLALKPFRL